MKVIILAAGRGSRLHPYTENTPKCLTELGGQTLINRQIETIRSCGIDDILIVTGYKAEHLKLPDTTKAHNPDWATTNMVESLLCAKANFGDDIIISYSDIIYEPRILKALLNAPHDASVVVDRQWQAYWEMRFRDPLSDAESLTLDDQGRITDIGQPVTDITTIEAQYMGLMRFRGTAISDLLNARNQLDIIERDWMKKRSVQNAYMTDLLMEMIALGTQLHAIPVDSGWLEIDTVEDYETADAMIADGSITRFYNPA